MDPSDFPSSITVAECLRYWGSDKFEATFLDELAQNEDHLPLQELCSNGFPSGWPELYDLQIKHETSGIVTGSFSVSFTEKSRTGCRDIEWKDTVRGRIDFRLSLRDGEVMFENPRPKREYEPEEF